MTLNNNLINKKVAFLSLGCKVNAYETEVIKESFISYGATVVDFKEKADIYVVNTCTVTNIADRKSRQMLHKARTENPDSIIVATGCYVEEGTKALEEDNTVNLLIGNRLKNSVAAKTNEYLDNPSKDTMIIKADDLNDYENMNSVISYDHRRVDIKIQDGCNQFCSYCIIPYARGRISSRNPREVVNEVKGLVDKGFKEVVLTGIHLSSYGLEDLSVREQANLRAESGRMPLLELIKELNEIEGLLRIRIGSVEPRVVTDEFIKGLSECGKFMPHFHISLQSGSDSVLKRMNRKYTASEYLKACEIIREYYYKPSITTDIIVGFPGESSEEFRECADFAKEVGFAAIHIFPYSKREGTQAARMDGHLTNAEKSSRAKELSLIEEELRISYEKSFEGEIRPVLVEEVVEYDGFNYIVGHTPEYVKVITTGSDEDINEIIDVTMTDEYINGSIYAVR